MDNNSEAPIETNPFDHILYEFSMYLQASLLISNNQFINNLLVDSRMVHMRNIAYFFCEKKNNGKSFLHYSTYIENDLSDEIDDDLFDDIQRITSNSTCHLLRGRFNEKFKKETALFEQEVFPQFVFLIKGFLEAANETIREEYVEQWNSELIQENANYILKQISCLENNN